MWKWPIGEVDPKFPLVPLGWNCILPTEAPRGWKNCCVPLPTEARWLLLPDPPLPDPPLPVPPLYPLNPLTGAVDVGSMLLPLNPNPSSDVVGDLGYIEFHCEFADISATIFASSYREKQIQTQTICNQKEIRQERCNGLRRSGLGKVDTMKGVIRYKDNMGGMGDTKLTFQIKFTSGVFFCSLSSSLGFLFCFAASLFFH